MKSTSHPVVNPDLADIDAEHWQCARQRMEAIAPLLKSSPDSLSRNAVQMRAAEIGKSPATLYRWFRLWRQSGENLSSLLPKKSGPRPGKNLLPSRLEEIITNILGSTRGKLPRKSAVRLTHRVMAECKRAGLTPPHPTTLRRRLTAQRRGVELQGC